MEQKTLFRVKPEEISPNPHNPRIIFDMESMDELKKSINKVGILVPLTVYRNTKNVPKSEYILLDGERRWRISKELGLKEIPVNVIDEPEDVTQNILYMFNIHHYRKEWELFPTALKLETLMKEMGTDSEKVVSDFTGVSRSTIRRCKMLLWMPEKYRQTLMEKNSKISTDFFIELYPIVHRVSYSIKFPYPEGIEKIIDNLIDIFEKGDIISDVKEFREIRKSMGYYEKKGSFDIFEDKLLKFIHGEVNVEIFEDAEMEDDRSSKNINKYIAYLRDELRCVNEDYMSDFGFVENLKSLRDQIDTLIENIE